MSLLEFAGRSFTSKTLSARLRPEGGYKKIPEPTLNATLRDVHDLLQASVVAVQKIIYGEDLGKTFTVSSRNRHSSHQQQACHSNIIQAFLAATGIFWLIKFLNPFALTVLAVTSIFLAPLVNSPQGRETARLAKQRGLDAASTAAESGKQLARDSKAKAAELSSNAQQSASQAASNVNTAAANAYGKASDTAGQLSSKAQDTAVQAREGLGSAYGQASDATGQLSSKAQGTASQAGTGASNAASNATQQARETANAGTTKLSQVLGGKTEAVNTSTGKGASPDSGHSGHGFDTDESASEYITDHNAASSTTDGVIGDVRSSTTGGTLGGGKVFSDVDDASSKYVAADNEAGKQGITNRAGGDIALGETVKTIGL